MSTLCRLATAAILAACAALPATAVAEPARPADAFTDSVGVNIHVMHTRSPYWDLEAARTALRTLGVRHVRDGLRWYTDPSAAWYNAELEKRLGSLARSGARLDLLLPGPDGATGTTAQALDLAAKLPGVQSVEAANEWDLNGPVATWPDDIRAQVLAARTGLNTRPALRGVPLVAPGFGRNGSAGQVGDLSAAVDVGNGHPYANGGRPELPESPGQWSLQRNIDTLRLLSGAKPFVLTEAGFHNALKATTGQSPVDEVTAATYQLRTLLEHFRLGATRTYLYELVDSWSDPDRTAPEGNWGLFRADWTPKPAALAVRNVMALLADGSRSPRGANLNYAITGGDANLRSIAFARAGGGFTLVLWRAESIWNRETRQPVAVPAAPLTVAFGRTFPGARVFRPAQSPNPVAEQGSGAGIQVAVAGDPVVIDLRPSTQDRWNAALRDWWCRVSPRSCR